MRSHHWIAGQLPDLPRWVEARATLLWEEGEVFGLREEPELSLVVRDLDSLIVVVGRPDAAAVQAAAADMRDGSLVAPLDQGDWLAAALPGWRRTRAILHLLPDPGRLPPDSGGDVGFVDPAVLDGVPMDEELRGELRSGAEHSPIAASFVDGRPVAFCYAGSITESLWDVAIDTLPEHRRQGHAARCAAFMIRHMLALGKRPVWGAVEENPASWRLAEKLGFVPVDELVLFDPPPST